MVITDIGKWEMLWEDSSIPMVKVMNLYSMTLRREMRRRDGYEVNTEGRMCRVVFQDPLNAIEWCLRLQLALLEVDWPQELLNKPYCSVSKKEDGIIRRGLLVAMVWTFSLSRFFFSFFFFSSDSSCFLFSSTPQGVSTGIPNITLNPVSNRPEYTGSMVIKTASICKLAQYGQVLVADSTLKLVESTVRSELFDIRPKITEVGDFSFTGFNGTEKIVQILPAPLSLRNFGNAEAAPSKPHLVRGVSDFQRSAFSDRRDTDPSIKIPPKSPSRKFSALGIRTRQSVESIGDDSTESPLTGDSSTDSPKPMVGSRPKSGSGDSLTKSLLRRLSRGLSFSIDVDDRETTSLIEKQSPMAASPRTTGGALPQVDSEATAAEE